VASPVQPPCLQPLRGASGRGTGEPGVLHHLGEFGVAEVGQVLAADQDRQVPIEVRRREERRVVVLDQRLLVGLVADPENDHVVIPFAGHTVHGVGARVAEEHERLPADLVDRWLPLLAAPPRDMRHRHRELMHVRDARRPTLRGDHGPKHRPGPTL
jgi:hypothetical protein